MNFPYLSPVILACITPVLTSCGGMIQKGAVINAQKHYDRGDYEKSLEALGMADPDNSEAMLLKARTYEARGEKEMARGYYKALFQKSPTSAEGIIAQQKLR